MFRSDSMSALDWHRKESIVHVCAFMHICMHVGTCEGQRLIWVSDSVAFYLSHWVDVSHLNPELADLASLSSQLVLGILQSPGVSAGDANPGTCAYWTALYWLKPLPKVPIGSSLFLELMTCSRNRLINMFIRLYKNLIPCESKFVISVEALDFIKVTLSRNTTCEM